jgi:hypothetical protein
LLAQHYWQPGNSVDHDATLRSLTGEGFSARDLAEACNRSTDEAWVAQEESMRAADARAYPDAYPSRLDATIRVVHGTETISDNSGSEEVMCEGFERWVAARFPPPAA